MTPALWQFLWFKTRIQCLLWLANTQWCVVYYLSCIPAISGPFCLSSTRLNSLLKNHRSARGLGLYRHSVNVEWMGSCSLQTLSFFICPSPVKSSIPEMTLNALSCTYYRPLCGPSAQLTNHHPFLLYPSVILILYLPLLILSPVLRIPFPSLPGPVGKFLVIFKNTLYGNLPGSPVVGTLRFYSL